MADLTRDSVVTCSCGLKFRVGQLVRLSDTHLMLPTVTPVNPEGHTVEWVHHAALEPKEACGWLNLLHGTGKDAMLTGGRHFVRLPY